MTNKMIAGNLSLTGRARCDFDSFQRGRWWLEVGVRIAHLYPPEIRGRGDSSVR